MCEFIWRDIGTRSGLQRLTQKLSGSRCHCTLSSRKYPSSVSLSQSVVGSVNGQEFTQNPEAHSEKKSEKSVVTRYKEAGGDLSAGGVKVVNQCAFR